MADALANYLFSNEVLFFYPDKTEKKSTSPDDTPVREKITAAPLEVKQEASHSTSPAINLFTKPLLVLVNKLDPADREFLHKILGSVKHTSDTIVLFDFSAGQLFPSEDFFRQQQTRKVLSFGVEMSRLDENLLVHPYQKKTYREFDFLLTDHLAAISLNQKDEKKLLWGALKEMFL